MPSIKLIYSSSLINVAAFLLIFGYVFFNFRYIPSKDKKLLLGAWSIFSAILLSLVFYGPFSNEAFMDVTDYFYLVFVIYLILAVSSYDLLKKVGILIFLWGLFVALWQIGFGIATNSELGQHYLTVSMPLGAALAYAIRFFFSLNETFKQRLFFAGAAATIFFALTLLLSRSAFIFNALILSAFLFSFVFINKNTSFGYKIFSVVLLCLISSGVYFFVFDQIEFRQFDRMVRLLEDAESESRMTSLYLPALSYISDRPILGYGMGASKGLYGNYPHNIFLEILSIGGLLLLLPFLMIFAMFLGAVFSIFKKHLSNPHMVGGVAFSLFLFLQFNSSFALVNSYIPIGAMVLLIVGFYDYLRNNKGITRINECE